MSDVRTPRLIAGVPLVPALWAAAATYPLMLAVTLILSGFALPGIDATFALMTYAAIILTFMGAVHWGLAVALPPVTDEPWYGASRDWRAYMASMAPGLAAWAAILLPLRAGAWLIAATFVLLMVYDRYCANMGEMPAYLCRIRAMMSTFAIAALTVGILFR